jgi:hypothetical protein
LLEAFPRFLFIGLLKTRLDSKPMNHWLRLGMAVPYAGAAQQREDRNNNVIARRPKADEAISIKISDGNWAKKFG